jgi:hypothetical protein
MEDEKTLMYFGNLNIPLLLIQVRTV